MSRGRSILVNTDWITVIIYLMMIMLGWLNIYSAVFNEEFRSILDFSQRYGKQLLWILAAILLAVTIFLIDSKFYFYFAYLIFGIAVLLLMGVLFFGTEVNGARSWYQLGGFHFQPSEFMKVATSLALAKFLSSYNLKLHSFKSVIILLFIVFFPALLVALQPDMGSVLIYFAFFIVVFRMGFSGVTFFIGIILGILFFLTLLIENFIILLIINAVALIAFWVLSKSLKKTIAVIFIIAVPWAILFVLNYFVLHKLNNYLIVIISLALCIPVFALYAFRRKLNYIYLILIFVASAATFTSAVEYGFHNVLKEHQRHRINILLGFEDDPLGLGYNVNQSKIAIGSGGFSGKGFLQGTQTKYDFVPEQSTDFIFCTVGEEWGFLGSTVVIGLFLFLLLRLIKIAERQRSDFSRMYGYGVISVLFLHFAINIGMTIGLLPVIGIPLPFFSYGGSSLWAFTILLFILLRLDASRMELLK